VRAVGDFVVWGSEPAGHISPEKAQWMMAALMCSSPKTARAVTQEIVRQAPVFDDDLRAFAPKPATKRKKRQRALAAA